MIATNAVQLPRIRQKNTDGTPFSHRKRPARGETRPLERVFLSTGHETRGCRYSSSRTAEFPSILIPRSRDPGVSNPAKSLDEKEFRVASSASFDSRRGNRKRLEEAEPLDVRQPRPRGYDVDVGVRPGGVGGWAC